MNIIDDLQNNEPRRRIFNEIMILNHMIDLLLLDL